MTGIGIVPISAEIGPHDCDVWRSDSSFDRVPEPAQRTTIDCNDIETARRQHPPVLQITVRGAQQATLLGWRDAGSGATMPQVGARAYFDKDQRIAVAHDQINFAGLAAKITLHQSQAILLQVRQCLRFTGSTNALARSWLAR